MIFTYPKLMNISVVLLACPFCNSDELTSTKEFGDYKNVAIKCLICNSTGPTTNGIEEAVIEWNRRIHPRSGMK